MYKLGTTKRFDKALKLCRKRGYPIEKLQKAIYLLVEMVLYLQNTNHIYFMVIMKVNGKLILNQIGF